MNPFVNQNRLSQRVLRLHIIHDRNTNDQQKARRQDAYSRCTARTQLCLLTNVLDRKVKTVTCGYHDMTMRRMKSTLKMERNGPRIPANREASDGDSSANGPMTARDHWNAALVLLAQSGSTVLCRHEDSSTICAATGTASPTIEHVTRGRRQRPSVWRGLCWKGDRPTARRGAHCKGNHAAKE